MEKTDIDRYSAVVNLLPKDESWKADFPLLVVALGLSYISHDGMVGWFDEDDYQPIDEGAELVTHPFNEDCYIYDVLLSKWR